MGNRIFGVILAGGRSSRMGREKAFVLFAGRPLIAHVISRFSPQVDMLALSANGDPARFAAFNLQVVADCSPPTGDAYAGPLAGLLSALQVAKSNGCALLATAAADAPFLPTGLVAALATAPAAADAPRLARGLRGMEPLFGLWPVSRLGEMQMAFDAGERAIHRLAAVMGCCPVPFAAAQPDPFLNVNTPADLARAEQALAQARI